MDAKTWSRARQARQARKKPFPRSPRARFPPNDTGERDWRTRVQRARQCWRTRRNYGQEILSGSNISLSVFQIGQKALPFDLREVAPHTSKAARQQRGDRVLIGCKRHEAGRLQIYRSDLARA